MNRLPRNTVLVGDAATRLAQLPENSVDSVLTSPPYFLLRDYAVPDQIGLEPTVDEWVDHLLAVLSEIDRVLKPEGTLWLNVADTYARHHRQGAPPKSLLLGPERLLLALTQRGWVCRNRIVWAKPNPMPSSVDDRFTAAHEFIYLLTHSRRYHFDLDAVRVPHRSTRQPSKTANASRQRAAWAGPLAGSQSGLARLHQLGLSGHPLGANPTDVWQYASSRGYGEHHATFPEALIERPILAGTPERVCSSCGIAWRRQRVARELGRTAVLGAIAPDCACHAGWRPGVVLDPFFGVGTTAVVAERHERDWVGIELNADFARVAEERIYRARAGPEHKAAA